MTITQMVQNQQQQRIGEISQKGQGKPHVNPYGTPGMSLNEAGDYRKIVPVDEGVVQQVKQIAFDHMKNGYGVSEGEDISAVIRNYTMSLSPEKRLSASWTLNEIFHSEAVRLVSLFISKTPVGTGGSLLIQVFWTATDRAWIYRFSTFGTKCPQAGAALFAGPPSFHVRLRKMGGYIRLFRFSRNYRGES